MLILKNVIPLVFFFFFCHALMCSLSDLGFPDLALKTSSPNHWTIREFSKYDFFLSWQLASPNLTVFYFLRTKSLETLGKKANLTHFFKQQDFGDFIEWLVNTLWFLPSLSSQATGARWGQGWLAISKRVTISFLSIVTLYHWEVQFYSSLESELA